MKRYTVYILLLIQLCVKAQTNLPQNGPADPQPGIFALKGATVYINAKTKIEQATIIIRKDKIEAVGVGVTIPKEAVVIDMRGKYIYPAFIDLYTNYGINWKSDVKPDWQDQFVSQKLTMGFGWNDAIRAEVQAATCFQPEAKSAERLLKMGFATAVTGIQDGICRGSAALVHIGQLTPHQHIIQANIAAGFSFNKGTATNPYPSSLMGSIALLRQTYYDAMWYAKSKPSQINHTLASFVSLMNLPGIFAVNDKLDIIRAARVAKEFNQRYIIKGSGNEYQKVEDIKQLKLPLVIPLNFPKAFDIKDAFEAEWISTTDLKHWEAAPFNPHILASNGIEFALTSDGCDDATQFLSNLKKAIHCGLPEEIAIQALTEVPARLIGQSKTLGSIQPGYFANLIVTDKRIFDKGATIIETWSAGKSHTHQLTTTPSLTNGTYKTTLENYSTLNLSGSSKPVAKLFGNDTLISVTMEQHFGFFTARINEKRTEIHTITLWADSIDGKSFPHQTKWLNGKIRFIGGETKAFTAKLVEAKPEQEKTNEDSVTKPVLPIILHPFTDYGWTQIPAQKNVVFKNATVWTSESEWILQQTDVAIQNGKIIAVGKDLPTKGAEVVDATNLHLTAGIIDEHSHIAIKQGVNEGTQAVTAEVRIGDAVDGEDINIYRQLSGGVVAAQLLHGSANPIGGQSALIKLRWGLAPEQMKIEGADGFIKFALGENVKQSNWGDRATIRYPQTRMGVEQVMIDAFTRAREYEKKKKDHVDLELEALLEILQKRRFISCHSYVQSEINMLMHVADSFKFNVNTFTHILEGYKVADKMKKHGVHASTFADWWAYKYEVIEAIPYNAAVLQKMGVLTAINSDDAEMGRRLNQEAAKAIKYGGVTEEEAWNMVTINPAKMLHLDKRMGSIKVGKDADLVVWSTNPLSIDAKALQTYVDGRCYFNRKDATENQKELLKERARLIKQMLEAIQNGEATSKRTSRRQVVYQCDTEELNDSNDEQ